MRYIVQLTGTQVKYGDDSDIFQFQLWEGPSNTRTVDDAVVDLTGSVITVDIANDSGFVGRFVTTSSDPKKGIVNVDMSNEIITALPADTYYFQVEVDNGTKKKIFPTDGGDIIKIFKSLTETQGELIPRVTFDAVLTSVDEKIAEYTKTIAKGDKGDIGQPGPKGDPGPQGERGRQIFKSSSEYYDQNSSGHWWSDLSPAVSVDNPPKIGDTIINSSGDIFQINTVNVGDGGGGGGTFGVGGVLGNIKGPQGPKGDTGDPNKRGQILDGYDLNGYKDLYTYTINGAKNLVNYPSGASTWAYLEVEKINDTTTIQRLTDTNNHIFIRTLGGNPAVWSAWSRVDTGYLDKLIAWETPKVYDIPMAGVFANSTVKGNLLVKGNTLSFNFGGSTGTLDAIPDADNVIGQLPDEVAKPLYTIRGFAINVSQSGAPDVAIRINTGGNITFNPDGPYTPKNTNEYWELSATGFTREVLNPLANTTYANALVLGAGIGGQGATFTKDYYMGMGGIDDIKLYVYDRNKKSQIVVDGGFGHNNDGFVGHANNLAVLKDESSTGGKIWLAASHMYNNGLAIISYTPSTGKGQTEGHITVTATDGTKDTSMLITSTQVMDTNGMLVVSAAGKLFKGTVDLTKLNTEQTASFSPISKNAPTANDYQNLVGSTLASLLTTGQSHWVNLENNLFYSIRTMNSLGFTISLVMEMKLLGASDNPVLTGNYWMTNEPSWSNNEIEAIWFENNKLMASYTQNDVHGVNMKIAELSK